MAVNQLRWMLEKETVKVPVFCWNYAYSRPRLFFFHDTIVAHVVHILNSFAPVESAFVCIICTQLQ